jgi:hypothetical protein
MADRVRAGSNRNILGLTPRMTLAVVAVFVGFQIYAQIGFKMAEDAFGGASGAPVPAGSVTLPAALAEAPLR